jgi:hypothetical protein
MTIPCLKPQVPTSTSHWTKPMRCLQQRPQYDVSYKLLSQVTKQRREEWTMDGEQTDRNQPTQKGQSQEHGTGGGR